MTEYYGVKTADVEIVVLAMDTALASIGGVCVGSRCKLIIYRILLLSEFAYSY